MARDLLAQRSVQQTLDRVVQYAVEMVDGGEHAGVLTVYDWQHARTLAVTSDLARRSDQLRGEPGGAVLRRRHPSALGVPHRRSGQWRR